MENLYQVQSIIGKRQIRGKIYYRVHWEGYSKKHDSWEPVENLVACDELIEEYETTKNINASNSSIPKVLSIDGEPSNEGNNVIKPAKSKRRSLKRATEISTKSPTAASPQLLSEAVSSYYNLRSSSKKDLISDCDALSVTTTSITNTLVHPIVCPTVQTSHDDLQTPQSYVATPNVKTQLEMQFDSEDKSQVPPISLTQSSSGNSSAILNLQSESEHVVLAPDTAKAGQHVLLKKPEHFGYAEYLYAFCIILIAIIGYVTTGYFTAYM